MPADNILVIAIDGLRASALGAYGNTSFSTPALDEFAVESFLLDACFADATQLPLIYRALWESKHPLRTASTVAAASNCLPPMFAARGYATTLVADDPAIASLAVAKEFAECVQLPESETMRAEDVSQTSVAQFIAAVCEQIAPSTNPQVPRLIWAHSRGLFGPWDAPLDFQASLLAHEEGDPSPCDAIAPPDLVLDATSDPDAIFAWSCGYAAQVMALDACFAGLWQTLHEAHALDDWLVVLTGVRGFPLGEHGRVGGVDGRLYVEQLHVPMLWRFPDGTGRLARSGQIASHLDLLPTLVDWLAAGTGTPSPAYDGQSLLPLARSSTAPLREALVAANAGQRAMRTGDWCLHVEPQHTSAGQSHPLAGMSADATTSHHELFVCPDDRWEHNDVAALCSDVVEQLVRRIDEISNRLERDDPADRAAAC